VYVPDGMPEHLAAGASLRDEDITELRGRFAGLRGQLRYLYEREKQFTAQIARLEAALTETRAALRPEIEGYVWAASALGYWPDGWCAREFRFDLTPSQAVREVELEAWAPTGLGAEQVLSLEFGDQCFEARIAPGRSRRCSWPLRLRAGETASVRIVFTSSWRPSSDGVSGDERELAFKLIVFRLRH